MAFTKYQNVEKSEVVSKNDAQRIASNLHNLGKTSATQLSDEERARALGSSK